MNVLVTGGCGFIASHFVKLLASSGYYPIVIDKMTYAADINRFKGIEYEIYIGNRLYVGDICDEKLVSKIVKDNNIDTIVNFAAETHVDRSIADPGQFVQSNIVGVQVLLEVSRMYNLKFIQVSTDEVYGELGETGKFVETLPLLPNSPYSASKASADLIIRSYHETYGLHVATARPSNNYGYYQYPEKFIPLAITNLLEEEPIPVYGEGNNVRDWLFTEDCCEGIKTIMDKGKAGEIYNVGGENEKRNIDIVKTILILLGKDESYVTFVKDRPGHDYRYAIDNSKIRKELGWSPKMNLETGLAKTVEWYRNNGSWWKPLKEKLAKESKGFWS